MEAHPEDAARVLAPMDDPPVVDLLIDAPPDLAGRVLRHLGPSRAAAVASGFPNLQFKAVLDALPRPVALELMRRINAEMREQFFADLSEKERHAWASALSFGEKSAGTLMDVDVLVASASLTVQDAIRQVENHPHRAIYYLYVVDDAFRLQGVLDLRELFLAFLAARKQTVSAIMQTSVDTLSPKASYHSIVSHPGWKKAHALPVVDEGGRLLGVIRYQTLRQIEQDVAVDDTGSGGTTVAALGDLFWTGIAGLAGAIGSGTDKAGQRRR
jgi:magnesium transporter